jgi:hypothetical protein
MSRKGGVRLSPRNALEQAMTRFRNSRAAYYVETLSMKPITLTDVVGWASTAVLLATIGRQVYSQWKSKATAGVSRWLTAIPVLKEYGAGARKVLEFLRIPGFNFTEKRQGVTIGRALDGYARSHRAV